MQHRPPQSYQGPAPLHPPQQQSRTVSGTQPEQQQHYPVAGVYNPQTGLQSPFLPNQPHFQAQPTPESSYYASHPSPRSQHSAAGPFYPADKPESMAATATMQRPYPSIYNTPQSNSPASVTSPQSHDPARPMYGHHAPQIGQSMYGYPQYQPMNQPTSYGHAQSQQQPHQLGNQPILQYPPHSSQLPQPGVASQHPGIATQSPRMKHESSQQQQQQQQQQYMPMKPEQNQQYMAMKSEQNQHHQTPQQQRPPMLQQYQQHTPVPPNSTMQTPQSQSGPPTGSNAAPGPIPATTPLVVKQDASGVQWIAFEYSRDRVKMEYTIRCDVESVDTNALTNEFKTENCVYPRATVPKDQYKGNRLNYETDCNQVGWALADLNPCLRGKRGLIQRAVDSWRNSNQDPRLRSRRVRRQAKITTRTKMGQSTSSQTPGPTAPGSAGLPGQNSMPAPSSRPPGPISTAPQSMHHHAQDISPTGHDNMPPSAYSTTPHQGYRQSPASQHMPSPNDIRQAQVFPSYQPYPQIPTSMSSMPPAMQPGMHHLGRPGGPAAMASKDADQKNEDDIALFGDVPEDKRRKFILVEDTQKNARVRVKVTLDQIEMSEIPDSYRKQNSVFPRAYYPVQMQSSRDSTRGDRYVEEGQEVDAGSPIVGRVNVPVQLSGGEAEVTVPQISQSKRAREEKVNELGYRMAWGQGRVFSNRPVFLARALDAYRTKQRSTLMSTGQDETVVPEHLETRPGKRRWREWTNAGNDPDRPAASTPSD